MNIFEIVVVQPIFNLLMGLYTIVPGRDFGVAIIIFTVIVRFALYPLTRSMLHQTKAMRKLQPELSKIKKQAKGNKQQESLLMMELYKKHGVNPFRSIGILLVQLPIFIALFQVIQIVTVRRNDIASLTYGWLENIDPIKDVISNPRDFNETLFGVIDLTQHAISNNGVNIALVLLAGVAGYTQYVMSKQTMPKNDSKRRIRDIMAEAAEGKQADQSEMNAIVMARMTKVLPFIIFLTTLGFPGALALYFAVSNLVAVVQQSYLLKQDEDELEDIAESGVKKQSAKNSAARSSKAVEGEVVSPISKKNASKKKKRSTLPTTSGQTVVRVISKDDKKRR